MLFYFQSYALISMVINAVGNLPAEAYFSEQLQNLIKHDKTGPISYLDTLRVFLRNSMSYSQTAEELYIHRSTVGDRISRIERELDVNLKDPDTRLQLEIILKAMEIEDMVQQSREEENRRRKSPAAAFCVSRFSGRISSDLHRSDRRT